jgi:hypothetical protein
MLVQSEFEALARVRRLCECVCVRVCMHAQACVCVCVCICMSLYAWGVRVEGSGGGSAGTYGAGKDWMVLQGNWMGGRPAPGAATWGRNRGGLQRGTVEIAAGVWLLYAHGGCAFMAAGEAGAEWGASHDNKEQPRGLGWHLGGPAFPALDVVSCNHNASSQRSAQRLGRPRAGPRRGFTGRSGAAPRGTGAAPLPPHDAAPAAIRPAPYLEGRCLHPPSPVPSRRPPRS